MMLLLHGKVSVAAIMVSGKSRAGVIKIIILRALDNPWLPGPKYTLDWVPTSL